MASTFIAGAGTEGARDGADDGFIRAGVLAALGRQSWGSRGGIEVSVADGVVDLGGVIFEESERAAVRVTVQNVPGVTSVRDHLKWLAPS